MKNSCIAIGGALVVACACGGFAQTASFQGIGSLAGATGTSEIGGVSSDGRVIVGSSLSEDGNNGRAFQWTTEEGIAGLSYLPGGVRQSRASAVSADGRVIVGTAVMQGVSVAVRWVDGRIEPLGDLGGQIPFGEALAVSADGGVAVGSALSPEGTQAFRWTPATGMVGLGDLPGGSFRSVARGVSADGNVVVGDSRSARGTNNLSEAMRWSESEGMIGLGDLFGGPFGSSAAAISGDGRMIVGNGRGPFHGISAAYWHNGGGAEMILTVPPFRMMAFALDVSHDGSVVVGYANYPDDTHGAFIWSPYMGRMRELHAVLVDDFGLDLEGWTLTEAVGISADGTVIVGNGFNPAGVAQGWVAYLPQACRGDVNRDGRVDGHDILGFHQALRSSTATDFNADGVVNSQDFFDFLTVFFSGC